MSWRPRAWRGRSAIRLVSKMSALENHRSRAPRAQPGRVSSSMLGLPWTRREQRVVREKALATCVFSGWKSC